MKCENCNELIGNLEQACTWNNYTLCCSCHQKLARKSIKYKDYLMLPRLAILGLAAVLTIAPYAAQTLLSPDADLRPPNMTLAYACWVIWILLSLIGSTQKSNWKQNHPS